MGKRKAKLGHAAHIKRHTVGTSNELSFSVLDAAKNNLDGEVGKDTTVRSSRFGHISLFTLPLGRKKSFTTPTKESGLPLSTGEFASGGEAGPSSPGTLDFGGAKVDAGSSKDSSVPSPPLASRKPEPSVALSVPAMPKRSPEEEVARRKSRRRRHRMLVAVLIVLIGLGVAGAGGWYLYQGHQRHMSQVERLDGALELIRQANETAIALDGIVSRPLDTASLEQADGVLERIPEAQNQLEEADRIVRSVSVDLSESRDKEAANQAVVAVAARKALLESGEQIVVSAQQADDAAQRIRAAWLDVVSADALARDAAALVVDTTDEHVASSKQKTEDAIAAFSSAQTALSDIALLYPALDLEAPQLYISKRLEALGYAIASDEALLAKNKGEAAAQNDAYNRVDSEAAAIAVDLPEDAAKPALDDFKRATEAFFETYSTARSQAGSADAFLRDYLGTSSK
ncbi:hypothetical protein [Gordonibacter sp.]|uniref:hypothetical protein n=1 Tax=Gordonibacter sp. TaxID=1968902 RepID=UPI002FCB5164